MPRYSLTTNMRDNLVAHVEIDVRGGGEHGQFYWIELDENRRCVGNPKGPFDDLKLAQLDVLREFDAEQLGACQLDR